MATSPKAAPAAESEQKLTAEEAGAKLNAMLADAASDEEKAARPKGGTRPKATEDKPKAEEKKAEEKPKLTRKKLGLSEVEGEVKDGAKVRIGVQSFSADGGEVNRTMVVPKVWKIVGPQSRPQNVHVIDADNPGRTICTLQTNWTSGMVEYPDNHYITCEPCARRMIAVNKIKQAEHDKRKKAAQDAAQKRREAEAKAEEAKADKAKVAEQPKEAPKPVAKPDPKPTSRPARRSVAPKPKKEAAPTA